MTPKLALEMRLYRNSKYHEDRQAHYAWMSRFANFLVIVAGSSGIAAALSSSGAALTALVAGLTAVIGAAQLVFDFGGKAHIHQDLRKSMLNLMAKASKPDADLNEIQFEMIKFYGDEPEIYHAVNVLAYNAAQEAFGRPNSTLIPVSFWQRCLRHVRRFDPSNFPDAVAS